MYFFLKSCFSECDDVEDSPSEAELDEYHVKATRSLFVGNLEKDISTQILTQLFTPYGEILVSTTFLC